MSKISQDPDSFQQLQQLLQQSIGLDPQSLGERVLLDVFVGAAKELNLPSLASLLTMVKQEPKSWNLLLEHAVVPESWFFRAPEQFADFKNVAVALHGQKQRCRVLCLPCAGGEEAYSIAMTLIDIGYTPEQIEVLAIDLSKRSIERARQAKYRRSTLRGGALHPMMQVLDAEHFTIKAAVRSTVRWLNANFFSLTAAQLGQFDAIFVRNLIIYLSQSARGALLDLIAAVSAPGTPVYAGHAELLPVMDARFGTDAKAKSSLSFVRIDPHAVKLGEPSLISKSTAKRARPSMTALSASAQTLTKSSKTVSTNARAGQQQSMTLPASLPQRLSQVRAMLDAGELSQAANLLQQVQADASQSAEFYYLQGLLALAQQQLPKADAALRQCLYLARDHIEALEQLLLVAKLLSSSELPNLQARLHRLRALNPAGGSAKARTGVVS